MSDAFDDIVSAFEPASAPGHGRTPAHPAVRPGAGAGRTPGRGGMALLLALWVVLGVSPFVFAVPDLRLATGSIGTPGTLTVISCEELGRGRYDCEGAFAPDGGGDAIAVDASPDSTAGDVGRAQLAPEGDRAVRTGTSGVLAALTMPFLGLGVLGFLPYVLLYVLGVRRGRRAAVALGGVLTLVSLAGIVVGIAAAYS